MSVTFKDIEKKVAETYIVSDTGILKLLCATVIANRLPVSPVWLFIIGASGSGKTAFLDTITDCKWMYPLSQITPNTFLSGFRGGQNHEASLLMQIPILKGGILIFKDFTTILSQRDENKREILAQMREVYDGTLTKRTGQGDNLHWPGKLGCIAATTDALYRARSLYSAMGERFIMYNPVTPERQAVAKRSMQNLEHLTKNQKEIKELVRQYLDETIVIPETLPPIDDELQNEIIEIADMTCRARTMVEVNPYTRDIEHVYLAEMPTRLSEQLQSIAIGLQIINNGPITDFDKKILYKIALDSIASNKRAIMEKITEYDEVETKSLAIELKYSTTTMRSWLEQLTALGICDRIEGKRTDRWYVKAEYRKILARYAGIELKGGVLEIPEDELVLSEDVFAGVAKPTATPEVNPWDEVPEEETKVIESMEELRRLND